MTQLRRHSALETLTSTFIGFWISYWLNYFLLPAFGHSVTHSENFWITIIFTIASLIRSYLLRRFFNRINTFLAKDYTK